MKTAKGLLLTYDIRELKEKRRHGLSLTGDRITDLKRAGLVDLTRDDKLMEMIAGAEKIDRLTLPVIKRKGK